MLPAHGIRQQYPIVDVLYGIQTHFEQESGNIKLRLETEQHLKHAVINLQRILCDAIALAPIQNVNPAHLQIPFDVELCNDVSSFLLDQLTDPNGFTVPKNLLVSLSDAIDEIMNDPRNLYRLGNRVLKCFYPSPALLVKLIPVHPLWQLFIGWVSLLIIETSRLWLTIRKTSGHAVAVYVLKSLFMSSVWYMTDFCFTLFSTTVKAPSWLCYFLAILLPQLLINFIKYLGDSPKIRRFYRRII